MTSQKLRTLPLSPPPGRVARVGLRLLVEGSRGQGPLVGAGQSPAGVRGSAPARAI